MEQNDKLQELAQPVLKVIQEPDVVARLKGTAEKDKNVDWLKNEYSVRVVVHGAGDAYIPAHDGPSERTLPLWSLPVLMRLLPWRCRVPVPLPHPFPFIRPWRLGPLG